MLNNKSMLRVKQIKSSIRRKKNQFDTLKGLGLGKINRIKILEDTVSIRGMLVKVRHLIVFEKVS